MTSQDLETWNEWGNYVLETLKRYEIKLNKIEKTQKNCELKCNVEITALKVKAGMIGAITGIVSSAIINALIVYIINLSS